MGLRHSERQGGAFTSVVRVSVHQARLRGRHLKKSPGPGAACIGPMPRRWPRHLRRSGRNADFARQIQGRQSSRPPLGGLACRRPPRPECPQRTASSSKTAPPWRARSAVAPQILAEIAAIRAQLRLPRIWWQAVSAPSIATSRAPCSAVNFTPGAAVPAAAIGLVAVLNPATAKPRAASLRARPHPPVRRRGSSGRIGRPRPRCAPVRQLTGRLQNFATHGRYPPRQSDDTYKLDE
jgi:hypothetical protein